MRSGPSVSLARGDAASAPASIAAGPRGAGMARVDRSSPGNRGHRLRAIIPLSQFRAKQEDTGSCPWYASWGDGR